MAQRKSNLSCDDVKRIHSFMRTYTHTCGAWDTNMKTLLRDCCIQRVPQIDHIPDWDAHFGDVVATKFIVYQSKAIMWLITCWLVGNNHPYPVVAFSLIWTSQVGIKYTWNACWTFVRHFYYTLIRKCMTQNLFFCTRHIDLFIKITKKVLHGRQ